MNNLPNTQLVIFGITSRLSRLKLLPAIYRLIAEGQLPEHFRIIGISNEKLTKNDVVGFMEKDSKYNRKAVARLKSLLQLVQVDVNDVGDYERIRKVLRSNSEVIGTCTNHLFYIAMRRSAVQGIVEKLGESKLNEPCHHGRAARLLIEKPFGSDLASAGELIVGISRNFTEEQVFRIDHYLAKDTTQNILTWRLENPLFQSVWHGRAVDRIVIAASEKEGVADWADIYDETGALRDLIQSHLMQLLAIVAMDEPASLSTADIHKEKLKLLRAVEAPRPDEIAADTLRAQYDGFTDEAGRPGSITETFAAIRLHIKNDRWRNVPVILATGKGLDEKRTEITLVFKNRLTQNATHNYLSIRIYPDEGIGMRIMVKKPGLSSENVPAEMDFSYARSFHTRQPDAYERVLADAIRGDRTLFSTSAEVLESWRIVEPVVEAWSRDYGDLKLYEPGTKAYEIYRGLYKRHAKL